MQWRLVVRLLFCRYPISISCLSTYTCLQHSATTMIVSPRQTIRQKSMTKKAYRNFQNLTKLTRLLFLRSCPHENHRVHTRKLIASKHNAEHSTTVTCHVLGRQLGSVSIKSSTLPRHLRLKLRTCRIQKHDTYGNIVVVKMMRWSTFLSVQLMQTVSSRLSEDPSKTADVEDPGAAGSHRGQEMGTGVL